MRVGTCSRSMQACLIDEGCLRVADAHIGKAVSGERVFVVADDAVRALPLAENPTLAA